MLFFLVCYYKDNEFIIIKKKGLYKVGIVDYL